MFYQDWFDLVKEKKFIGQDGFLYLFIIVLLEELEGFNSLFCINFFMC